MKAVDQHISIALKHYAGQIEGQLKCDVVAYVGPIHHSAISTYLEIIEQMKTAPLQGVQSYDANKLAIVLTTPGGVVEAAEKMVEITRHHYQEVDFVVPDYAMSAGTVWCMSGDRIWMDYASSLGPIDPQLQRQNNQLVPALGYIDKVNEFIKKSQAGELSPAEVLMLRSLDLAELRRFEQARDLSITLLKQWLVAYKFKNWTAHRTHNAGALVTAQEKEQRAEEIAKHLSDNNRWHSHGRMIGMATVRSLLRLEVDDYSGNVPLRSALRTYTTMLSEYVERHSAPFFVHTSRL